MSENGKPPVQYVLVRADLNPVVQMVQVGHATAEAIRTAPISRETHIRLLHVANEVELMLYSERLSAKGFYHALVREPDAPYNGQAMSLATEPSTDRINALGKIFYHLKAARLSFDRLEFLAHQAWLEEHATPSSYRCLCGARTTSPSTWAGSHGSSTADHEWEEDPK